MRSVHDFAIASLVEKLRAEGKVASDTHNNHNKPLMMGRIPDVIVENPPELYEVEVVNKRPLPKQNGTKRILLIVTALDWDAILITSDRQFREASEIELNLHSNFQQKKQELDTQINFKWQTLSGLETKLVQVENRLSETRKEYQRVSHYLSSTRRGTRWDAYLLECLEREKQLLNGGK